MIEIKNLNIIQDVNSKLIFVTNFASYTNLPVIENIFKSKNIKIELVVFFNNIPKHSGFIGTIKKHGLLKVIEKAITFFFNRFVLGFYKIFKIKIGNKYFSTYEFCVVNKIQYIVTKKFNETVFLDRLQKIKADILLSCNLNKILSYEIINTARFAINIHPSILPRHRGPDPLFWTLFNADKMYGYTLHILEQGIDKGKIVKQETFSNNGIKSLKVLTSTIYDLIGEKIAEILNDFITNRIKLIEQDENIATYETFPTTDQRKIFFKKGNRF